MCKKLIYLIACAVLLSAASGVQAAVLEITPTAPVPGEMDIANFVGAAGDLDNVGTVTDPQDFYTNDATTYVAHDRGGQGQTFLTGDNEAGYLITGVWVQHAGYTEPCITWYSMQVGSQLDIRITDPAASGTSAFVLSSESYVVTGEEENRLPEEVTSDPLGTGLWIHVILDEPVALAANTEYGFDLTSISGLGPVLFFETLGIKDDAEGGNPYPDGSAYVTGSAGAADNVLTPAPGDRVFVVELELAPPPEPEPVPVHQYTFEDGTANDSVGEAHGTLVGDATVTGGALVLDGDGDWMEMPGDVIAMNTYSEVSIETWFTSVAGGNTGFHMLAAFGEEATGALDWAGYKYLFITPARGDDVSRAAIQTRSMDDSPWDDETGVSATVEHDDGLEHHFVATVTATDIAFYIDGELIGSAPLDPNNSVSGISQAVAYLGKGVYPADPLWTGSIQEFNIYDRALSPAQVEANYAAGPVKPVPVHQYTFEDGTANDSVGEAHGTLIGDATVTGGALVLDGDGDWMEMPGDVIAMNTYSEVSIEAWFTSVAGGNTGFHMLAAFGEEATGALDWAGYKYLFITPARGDDVSRAAIQTRSMDDSPWDEETGVSATVEHDDGLEHHFVATVTAADIAFYIDGALIGSAPLDPNNSVSGISQAVAYLGKGVYPADPLWTGSINEFNIYSRALSLADVEANYAAGPVKPLVHSYTFEDGTANDSVGEAHGTLVGDAAVVDGALVLDGDGDWMDMPGDLIAMNTYSEVTIETWFTPVSGGNTGFHMVTAFGEEGTGDNPGAGYKYVCITPARGDDVSRAMIQTVSMDNDPWTEETGVSDVIEHDDGLPHHMVCTVDDTELAFYVDGVLIGTAALDPPGNSIAGLGTDVARIGKGVYGVDPLWAGSVEELNIYNRALSLAEVEANYAAGPQKAGPAPVDPGTEGLVMYLPLDTASRGVTQDSSDNDLDGTLFGDPTFVEGVVVMALDFDGDGDYVDCGNDPILDITGPISIALWIRPGADDPEGQGTETAPMAKAMSGMSPDWSWQVRYGWGSPQPYMAFTFNTSPRAWAYVGRNLERDEWCHIACSYDGTTLKCYLNGEETDSTPMGAITSSSTPVLIGSDGWGCDWIGAIDEVDSLPCGQQVTIAVLDCSLLSN